MLVFPGASPESKRLRFKLAGLANDIIGGASQVIINGVVGRQIIRKRGFLKSDPISPYLFILVMDFLVVWLQNWVNMGLPHVPLPGIISCLLYADDTLALCGASNSVGSLNSFVILFLAALYGWPQSKPSQVRVTGHFQATS